ncbi:hypothetical protein GOV03_03365 [Candidatus Woesearchaeota archaeon]|nr:hypothetical protein [Candidatus Woesearchaeota archaeon]
MKQLELLLLETDTSPTEKQYKVPGRIEDPTCTYGMLRQFLIDFHKQNEMTLPKRFHSRNKKQLKGMYYGMRSQGYFKRKEEFR